MLKQLGFFLLKHPGIYVCAGLLSKDIKHKRGRTLKFVIQESLSQKSRILPILYRVYVLRLNKLVFRIQR